MNIHDVYRPFLAHFRSRRMMAFLDLFEIGDDTRILDVGGHRNTWALIDRPPKVLLLNVEAGQAGDGPPQVAGDGRRLQFADDSFDLAFSNSVIEHVGDAGDQADFAREIRRVAPRYYVQTPNRAFFVEPHLIAAFVHWLPVRIQRRLVRYFSVWGLVEKPGQAQIDSVLASIRLLDETEFRALFPDAELRRERFLGMTKSLIAIRR
jgi:SAM-dependent methyltransferase